MQENSITTEVEQRDAFRLDAELKNHANNVVGEMIEVGRCLKEINDRKLYKYLDSSTFAEYAEAAVGLKERAAYNYITAFETYGESGLKKYGEIGITKLVALAQLNDTDRAELLESGQAAELSTRELKEQIKELKGENDQLRFEANDAETSAKNNAVRLAALQKEVAESREEIARLKQDLTEAQRPVVADMTDEEKEDIRREAEKKARSESEDEIRRLKKQAETAEKNVKDLDKIQTEQANKIAELSDALEAATTANAQLQANAEKTKKPPLSGSKEALKFCLEDVQQQFTRAIEIVSSMEGAEKDKFRAALLTVPDKLRAAAEGIK